MITRRQFLHTSAIACTGLLFTHSGIATGDKPSATPLLQRTIPSSGERIAVIGAGTSGSYDVAPGTPEYEKLQEVLKVFFASGATLIDTSPNYGRSEPTLGRLLADGGWRKQCFVATKIAADSRREAEVQWRQTLQDLGGTSVDLLQVHNLRAWREQLPFIRELKAAGATRYIGVTHYQASALPQLETLLRSETLDFIQINYSVNAPEAAKVILPLAADKGVAVLVNRAFDDGRLFSRVSNRPLPGWASEMGIGSWAQLFLKFAISHPAVTTVIPATGKPERQADNLRAGVGPLLSAAQCRELTASFS